MGWILAQLALLYAQEQYLLQQHVAETRNRLHEDVTRAFNGTDGTWNLDDGRFQERMRQLHERMTLLLALLMGQLLADMLRYQTLAYRFGYYTAGWQIGESETSVLRMPPLLDARIQQTMEAPYLDATLRQRLYDVQVQAEMEMRRAWTLSQTEGETLLMALKRTDAVLGVVKSPEAKSLWGRTGIIAESEMYRGANGGAHAMLDENAPLVRGKQWHTVHEPNVCRRCEELDSTVVPLDEWFTDDIGHTKTGAPPLHPLCRCYLTPARLTGMVVRKNYREWALAHGVEPGMDGTGLW